MKVLKATQQEREEDEDTLLTLTQLIHFYGVRATLAGMAAYHRTFALAVNYVTMSGSDAASKSRQIVNAVVINERSDSKRTNRLRRAIANRARLRE
jgi:hypothetical protein